MRALDRYLLCIRANKGSYICYVSDNLFVPFDDVGAANPKYRLNPEHNRTTVIGKPLHNHLLTVISLYKTTCITVIFAINTLSVYLYTLNQFGELLKCIFGIYQGT